LLPFKERQHGCDGAGTGRGDARRSRWVHAHAFNLVQGYGGLRGFAMNEVISRRKLLLFAGLGASIAFPASTLLTASVAEAQQNDQTAPADAAPKKKTKKKKSSTTSAAPPAKPKAQ
jgi:hypothetical protein